MPKNITISMPDDVAADMDAMPEINWSAVAKASIKTYIESRKKPDITALLDDLLRQKSEEYVNGRKKAEEIARSAGYRTIDIILRKYYAISDEVHGKAESGFESYDIPDLNLEFEKVLLNLKVINAETSDEYLKGIKERLEEIAAVVKQQK